MVKEKEYIIELSQYLPDYSQLFVKVNWPQHINPFLRRRPSFLLLLQDNTLLSTEKNPFNYLYTGKSLHREMAM